MRGSVIKEDTQYHPLAYTWTPINIGASMYSYVHIYT